MTEIGWIGWILFFITCAYTFFFTRRLYLENMKFETKLHMIQAILDHSTSCIYLKDTNLRYLLANRYALQFFNFKEKEVIGKTDEDLFSPDYANSVKQSDLEVLNEGKIVHEETSTEINNEKKVLYTIKAPLKDEKNIPYAICGIAFDITPLKNTQQQLNDYLEKLESITTELMEARITSEQANKVKNSFLANMSHELRTPLNSIIGNITLLYNTDLSEKQITYVERVKHASQLLIDIIGLILDFSKIAAGELKLESIPCNLLELVQECCDLLLIKADEKKIDLYFCWPDSEIPLIMTDPKRLKQVIINLMGNAVKFTEKGHVHFSFNVLSHSLDTIKIQFKIKDTGIGISEDKMEHLFEKFWQADASNTRKYGGTGLGLAICKELVEHMHGQIYAESSPNNGSEFIFEIPFSIAEQSKIAKI